MKLSDLAELLGVSVEEVKRKLNESDTIEIKLSDKSGKSDREDGDIVLMQ